MAEKRRRLTNLEVREVSLVGLGANQPAKVVLFKSADDPAHPATAPSDPPIVTETPSVVGDPRIAPVLTTAPVSQENKSMTEVEIAAAAVEKTAADAAAVEKAAALEAKIKGLEDAVKASDVAKAEAEAKAESLAKTVAVHEAAVRKAEHDALVAKTVAFVKDTYKALPNVKAETFAVALIAVREKAPDEAKAIEAALKSANDAIENSPLFRSVGVASKSDEAVTAESEYDKLVAKTQSANPGMSKALAGAKALETAEGREVYRQMISAPPAEK